MGVFSGATPSELKRSGNRHATDPADVAAERRQVIDQEIARLQALWRDVQVRIDAGTSGHSPRQKNLQLLVTEGDRLLLMIGQLEKARAALS